MRKNPLIPLSVNHRPNEALRHTQQIPHEDRVRGRREGVPVPPPGRTVFLLHRRRRGKRGIPSQHEHADEEGERRGRGLLRDRQGRVGVY